MKSVKQCQSTGLENIEPVISRQLVESMKQDNQQLKNFLYEDYFYSFDQIGFLNLQISPNEKLIAFRKFGNQLTIMSLVNKQIVKLLKCEEYITKCKFSSDSNFIYCGDFGILYCFDIKQDFKMIYKREIHNNYIFDIKLINNEQVIISSEKSIIVSDIKKNNQLLTIRATHYIQSIEYDSANQIIISCQNDKSIKFFQMNGNMLIDKQNAHDNNINQIQLIYHNNLISHNISEIKEWKIDYDKKQLIQIRKFIEKQELFQIQYIKKEQVFNKIYPNQIQILDHNFKVIKKQKHQIKYLHSFRSSDQLTSNNFLLITGELEIQILKRRGYSE